MQHLMPDGVWSSSEASATIYEVLAPVLGMVSYRLKLWDGKCLKVPETRLRCADVSVTQPAQAALSIPADLAPHGGPDPPSPSDSDRTFD